MHYSKSIFHYSLNKITVRGPSKGRIMEVFFTITAITGITEKRRITPKALHDAVAWCCWLPGESWGKPRGKTKQGRKEKEKNAETKEEYKQ